MVNMLEEVVQMVLRDVAATSPLEVRIDPQIAMVQHGGEAVYVTIDGLTNLGILATKSESFDERLLTAANDIQDLIVESLPTVGRPAVWPECPRHPGTHPLEAKETSSGIAWTCPEIGTVIAPIGSLHTVMGA